MIFPFFYAFFPFFYAFFPFLSYRKDKGKQQQFTAKMENFTPTPSAPTPCKTSRQEHLLLASLVWTGGSYGATLLCIDFAHVEKLRKQALTGQAQQLVQEPNHLQARPAAASVSLDASLQTQCLQNGCFYEIVKLLFFGETLKGLYLNRRRTNVQQLTCKIDLSSSFYYLFLSFVLLELKPFVLKGKVPGEKS